MKKGFILKCGLTTCDREHGFTLIELLIVIAILGTLAVVVLLALNPTEQLAKARDAGRKEAVSQLGSALESYVVANGTYPPPGAQASPTWMQSLVDSGSLRERLPLIVNGSGTPCWGDATAYQTGQNNYCYVRSGSRVMTWTNLESKSEKQKCGGGIYTLYVYDSLVGHGCIKCNNSYSGACNSVQ